MYMIYGFISNEPPEAKLWNFMKYSETIFIICGIMEESSLNPNDEFIRRFISLSTFCCNLRARKRLELEHTISENNYSRERMAELDSYIWIHLLASINFIYRLSALFVPLGFTLIRTFNEISWQSVWVNFVRYLNRKDWRKKSHFTYLEEEIKRKAKTADPMRPIDFDSDV